MRSDKELLLFCLCGSRRKILKAFGRAIGRKPDLAKDGLYHYWQGEHPVCLVAHLDTVFEDDPGGMGFPPKVLVGAPWGRNYTVLTAPETGLGADDRAGVAMILSIVLRGGVMPSVLLCDGEESGGVGASAFCARMLREGISPIPGVSCFVELDRHGKDQVVYYSLNTADPEMEEFCSIIESEYIVHEGSFSDISILGPGLSTGACNLSTGGYNQHSTGEYLVLQDWASCRQKLINTMKKAENIPHVSYVERKSTWEVWGKQASQACLEEDPFWYDEWTKGGRKT